MIASVDLVVSSPRQMGQCLTSNSQVTDVTCHRPRTQSEGTCLLSSLDAKSRLAAVICQGHVMPTLPANLPAVFETQCFTTFEFTTAYGDPPRFPSQCRALILSSVSTCHSSTLPSQPAVENLPVGRPSGTVKMCMSTTTLLCPASLLSVLSSCLIEES